MLAMTVLLSALGTCTCLAPAPSVKFCRSLVCLYHLHVTPAYLAGGGTGQHDRVIMDCMHSNELVLLSRPVVCNVVQAKFRCCIHTLDMLWVGSSPPATGTGVFMH